jgi:hypothetical protein
MKTLRRWLLLSLALTCLGVPVFAAEAASSPDDGKIDVIIEYFGPSDGPSHQLQQKQIQVKRGTTAMEMVKQAGLEKRLTNSAILRVITYPSTKDRNERALAATVDVGAVRAGKAKDFALETIPGAHTPMIAITYGDFNFPGGSPSDFAAKLTEVYGVDWNGVQIPQNADNFRVPPFRKESDLDDANIYDSSSSPAAVVALYNSIANRYPGMGQWSWEGNIYKPQFIMLANAVAPAAPALKVKALPLGDIPEKSWGGLEEDVRNAQDEALAAQRNITGVATASFDGRILVQANSKILVSIGTPGYIEMVESVVAAYEKNAASVRLRLDHPAAGNNP